MVTRRVMFAAVGAFVTWMLCGTIGPEYAAVLVVAGVAVGVAGLLIARHFDRVTEHSWVRSAVALGKARKPPLHPTQRTEPPLQYF